MIRPLMLMPAPVKITANIRGTRLITNTCAAMLSPVKRSKRLKLDTPTNKEIRLSTAKAALR
jgi:hypothetical protein